MADYVVKDTTDNSASGMVLGIVLVLVVGLLLRLALSRGAFGIPADRGGSSVNVELPEVNLPDGSQGSNAGTQQ